MLNFKMNNRISFRNDYSSIAHPKILEKLNEVKDELNTGYGEDIHTINLKKKINELLNNNADIYILAGGTQTNMVFLSSVLRPHEAIIAAKTAHINVHETGAVEGQGHKILTISKEDGKLIPNDIKKILDKHIDNHMVKPKVVFITNATEVGTVYQKEEIKALYDYCHDNDLYLYLDGARLAVSFSASNLTFEDYGQYTDAFYIGGTKIGAPFGEVLVINNDKLKTDFNYLIKHYGAMLAKGFVPAICFEALFEDNLYFKLGEDQNKKAQYLTNKLKEMGIKLAYESKTNQIFVVLTEEKIKELEKDFIFERWDKNIVRFVIAYHNTYDEINLLINQIKN